LKTATVARIIRNKYCKESLRATYWSVAALTGELRTLFRDFNRAFRKEVIRYHLCFAFSSVSPVIGETK
jgi:hypothetical protein